MDAPRERAVLDFGALEIWYEAFRRHPPAYGLALERFRKLTKVEFDQIDGLCVYRHLIARVAVAAAGDFRLIIARCKGLA